MFIVTDAWLRSNLTQTPHGFIITVDQANLLGEKFPLKAGWWSRVVGKQITDIEKQRFEMRLTKKVAKRTPMGGDSLEQFEKED